MAHLLIDLQRKKLHALAHSGKFPKNLRKALLDM